MPFWQALGFTDTGERRPYRYGPVQSSAILLERPVDDKLPMSNMSVLSSRVEGEERER
jgi:hypothetical protein